MNTKFENIKSCMKRVTQLAIKMQQLIFFYKTQIPLATCPMSFLERCLSLLMNRWCHDCRSIVHHAFSSPCLCMNLPMQTTLYLSTGMSRYLFIFIPNFCGMDISTMHGPCYMKFLSSMGIYVNMFQQYFQGHDVIVTSSTSNLMKI